jgi:hypothetical protein
VLCPLPQLTLFCSGQKITQLWFTGNVAEAGQEAVTDAQRDSLERKPPHAELDGAQETLAFGQGD